MLALLLNVAAWHIDFDSGSACARSCAGAGARSRRGRWHAGDSGGEHDMTETDKLRFKLIVTGTQLCRMTMMYKFCLWSKRCNRILNVYLRLFALI